MCYCRLLRSLCAVYCNNTNRFLFFSGSGNRSLIQKRFIHIYEKNNSDKIFSTLRRTEAIWRRHRNQEILEKYLFQSYEKNNGLPYVINLLTRAVENRSCSSEVVYSMLITFEKYLQSNNITISSDLIQWKDILSSILKYKYYHLVPTLCSIFKIVEQTESFKEFIQDLLQKEKLTEAAYCISTLNLQNEYPVEKVLLPLLLEGKLHPAVIYMTENNELQLHVAKILDSYLKKITVDTKDSSSHVDSRKVFKALTTMVNVFKISPAHCTNLHHIRSKGAIRLLLKRRNEQSISEATFEEMIKGVIGGNVELKKFLICKLISKNDIKTAERMAKKLNVYDLDIPSVSSGFEVEVNSKNLTDDHLNGLEEISDGEDDLSDSKSSTEHLVLTLNSSDLKLIIKKEQFISCINEICQNYDIIGIDSEWKPRFGLFQERLSLMQIAVWDKIFILDLLLLTEQLHAADWDKFMDDIFANSNIIKLGCGITSDIHMILESNRGSKGKTIKFSHVLDMSIFYQKLQQVYPEKLNGNDVNNLKGLSALCEIILGKPLNKEERLCDWEKRPLKETQLKYAALDAHCLLQMYEKLKENAAEMNMNFNHLTKVAMAMTAGVWKPKKRIKCNANGKSLHIQIPVPIEEFKVIIDPKLKTLGENLRQFGANVLILQSTDTPEDAIKISKSEKRIIICLEELWKQVKHAVPDGYSYNASREDDESISASQIFMHFNVQFSHKNIML